MKTRHVVLAAGFSGLALVATGCSSSSSTSATSSAPPSPTEAPTSAAPTPTSTPTPTSAPDDGGGAKSAIPTPPAGATLLGEHKTGPNEYARYKIQMPPKKVVNKYKRQAKSDGYSIKSAGGSGGGWGGYGGSEYGMTATKSSAYLEVQAGGSTQGPTYYEVCVSQDGSRAALDHCDKESQRSSDEDSRSQRS